MARVKQSKGGRIRFSTIILSIVLLIAIGSIYSISHQGDEEGNSVISSKDINNDHHESLISMETAKLAKQLEQLELITEKTWKELTMKRDHQLSDNGVVHEKLNNIDKSSPILSESDKTLHMSQQQQPSSILKTADYKSLNQPSKSIMDESLTPLTDWKGNGKCGKDGIVAVTYASHGGRDDRFCRAVESAIRNDIPWEILGWGVKWEGLSQKLQASLDYAKTLDPECILLFSDAFDVLFTQGLPAIKESFQSSGHSLLFAGECGCWPQVVLDEKRGYPKGSGHICNHIYPESPTPYRFLNSGLWMGYASKAVKLLEAVVDLVVHSKAGMKTNDQELVSDMYIDRKFNISLDSYASVFQCLHETGSKPLPNCNPSKHLNFEEGKWKNKLTKTQPAVFHFNGGGKAHHLSMERQLPYMSQQYSNEEKEKFYNTKLRFNGQMTRFSKICPDHIAKSRGRGRH